MKQLLTFTIIGLVGFFSIYAVTKNNNKVKAQTDSCVVWELDSTEYRIFQVAADLDTIGQRIDSIEAKLDSLSLYKEMN